MPIGYILMGPLLLLFVIFSCYAFNDNYRVVDQVPLLWKLMHTYYNH